MTHLDHRASIFRSAVLSSDIPRLWVDTATDIPESLQTGAYSFPFKTAVQGVARGEELIANTSATARIVPQVWLVGGTYDEDIVLTARGSSHVQLVGYGPVNIGLMNSNSWRPSGTLRNITITGDTGSDTRIDNVRAFVGIMSLDDSDNNGGHSAANSAFRISGELIVDLPDSTGNNIVINLSSVQIFGTTAGDTGTSIRVLNNSNGGFQIYNCFFNGKCELGLDGDDITRTRQTRFRGLVTNEKTIVAESCDFLQGITVRDTAFFTNVASEGFIDCNIAGPLTATEAGIDFMFDQNSQDHFIASINNPSAEDRGVVVGTTILATVSEPYAPGTDTLTLDIDNGGNVVTTFDALDTTAQLVVDRINAAFVTAVLPEPAVVAAENTLQLSGVLLGPDGEVDVVSGTGGILAALGLTVAVTADAGAKKSFRGAAFKTVFVGGGAPTGGQFYESNAAASGTAGAADVSRQSTIQTAGNLISLVVDTTSADATTVMSVRSDGVVVDTITLTGATGVFDLPRQYQHAVGEAISVEFVSGTAPGAGTVKVISV